MRLEGDVPGEALGLGEVEEARSRSGEMLEAATARTFPSFTSWSSAVTISSTGTDSSSKCV